eukprot:scaffold25916_cov206-Amphora_coffeaeformis.AAC.3
MPRCGQAKAQQQWPVFTQPWIFDCGMLRLPVGAPIRSVSTLLSQHERLTRQGFGIIVAIHSYMDGGGVGLSICHNDQRSQASCLAVNRALLCLVPDTWIRGCGTQYLLGAHIVCPSTVCIAKKYLSISCHLGRTLIRRLLL